MSEFQRFIRTHLDDLPPYTPIEPFEVLSRRLGRPPQEIIKLDANENPYGPSPRARQALADLRYAHIYPDPESRALRAALEKFTGVPPEALLAGAGADELIDLLLRVMVESGESVLVCPPTFGMYAFDTRLNAARVVSVPRRADFSLDIAGIVRAIEQHHPRLLFVATPNNPDGSTLRDDEIKAILELPLMVVLDEAYIEFSDGDLGSTTTRIRQVIKNDNLVVLRTFSKWAGLAGLRVGYGAFPAWLMPTLWKSKQPYNINVAASETAIASLEDREHLQWCVALLRQERQRLADGLQRIPWLQPYPSRSNFILCRVTATGKTAAELKQWLALEHGILVRYFDVSGLQDHIRISVGKPEHTQALLRALREVQ
jgi:histidinol-phosphate aminotransferase